MGLMLSVLISCAGVAELISCLKRFKYSILPNESPDFADISRCYSDELSKACLLEESMCMNDDDDSIQDGVSLQQNGVDILSDRPVLSDVDCRPLSPRTIKVQHAQNYDDSELDYVRAVERKKRDKVDDIQCAIKSEGVDVSLVNGREPVNHKSEYDRSLDRSISEVSSLTSSLKARPHFYLSSSMDTNYSLPEIHFDAFESARDVMLDDARDDDTREHYSEDFLRSLDGVKFKPLQRDDGTGRRKSFKKRHSSDSASSRESRLSRDEELMIFTSLEESEFENLENSHGKKSIYEERYSTSSEPSLRVKHSHRSRRKREKERSIAEPPELVNFEKGSIETVQENNKNGHVSNEERRVSFALESEDIVTQCGADVLSKYIPKVGSFEEATDQQHEEIKSTLKRSLSFKNDEVKKEDNPGATQSRTEILDTNENRIDDDEIEKDGGRKKMANNDPGGAVDADEAQRQHDSTAPVNSEPTKPVEAFWVMEK